MALETRRFLVSPDVKKPEEVSSFVDLPGVRMAGRHYYHPDIILVETLGEERFYMFFNSSDRRRPLMVAIFDPQRCDLMVTLKDPEGSRIKSDDVIEPMSLVIISEVATIIGRKLGLLKHHNKYNLANAIEPCRFN